MSEIITDPAAMVAFAKELNGVCQKLKAEEAKLFHDLGQLGKTWQDPKFKAFKNKVDEASRALAHFHKNAENYCHYLQKKAAAGQRILGR